MSNDKQLERAELLLADLSRHFHGDNGKVWLGEFDKFMNKTPCWTKEVLAKEHSKKPLLTEQYRATIMNPVNSYRDFLEHKARGGNLCFFDVNFSSWFIQLEPAEVPPSRLLCREINRSANDLELITALGGEAAAETPLPIFFGALLTQLDGSPSIFGESDVLHIFYVRDHKGQLRALSVACKKGHPQFIAAHSLISNARWDKGRRVFSPCR